VSPSRLTCIHHKEICDFFQNVDNSGWSAVKPVPSAITGVILAALDRRPTITTRMV
jgi:hypothetical protein